MSPPLIVSEPRHYLRAVVKCPHCGEVRTVVEVQAEWTLAADPHDGTPNRYTVGLLDDGQLVRLWQRG